MFRPKKTIPKLAVAMLALTGCGGDGGNGGAGTGGNGMGGTGGTGGGDGGNFDASLAAFCVSWPCFNLTVAGCINYYTEVMPINYDIDAECEAALLSYFDCGASKSCNEVLAGACDDLYDAVFDVHCTPLQ